MNYDLNSVDEVQSHVLSIISGLMVSYSLNPAQVQSRHEYNLSLSKSDITNSYMESMPESVGSTPYSEITCRSESKLSWGDRCVSSDDEGSMGSSINNNGSDSEEAKTGIMFVATRRQFCDAMQKGVRICPRYSTCIADECKNFHVRKEHICPHVTKGNYCEANNCDLIVIRACRKGKRCNDNGCSFRH